MGCLALGRRSSARAGVAACALLVAALVARSAWAAPTTRLVYSRDADAESCPDEDALRRAVAARVGYDAFFPWAKRTIVARISRSDGAFVASVDLVDERGIRHGGHQLRTESECSDLLDAVALAVAIAIDPQLLLARPAPIESASQVTPAPPQPMDVPSPVTSAAPPVPPADVQPAPVLPGPTRAPPVVFEGSLGVTASIGVTPAPAVGGTLGGAIRWRPLRRGLPAMLQLSLGLEGFVAGSTDAARGGGSISSVPVLATLVPCLHVGPVFACPLAQAGTVFIAGEGVTGAQSATSRWWAVGGRVGGSLRLTDRLDLRLRVDVLRDLSLAAVQFNDQPQWTAPPVAGALGVDAVVRFP
jgi:hypothetical protein